MKTAMWGIGIIAIGIVAFFIVSIFGNITVTNQLNYTTMKNTIEAAMYDSLDIAHYRTGFCLCTNKTKDATTNKYVFNDSNEYFIKNIENGMCYDAKWKTCESVNGEYKIDKKVFSESVVRRFAEMVNNDKDYKIIIQDVIEYPPKVSIRVDSKDKNVMSSENFTIANQVDALIETYK